MKSSSLKLISALTAILLFSLITSGQTERTLTSSSQPGIYFVPDVVGQFDKLARRPDALGFGLRNAPDPHIAKHFQGIVRRHGTGTPYLFLSRSGNDVEECIPCGDDPGNIYIVKMESRDINGERLRSNRLAHDLVEWATPPPILDRTVRTIHFNGQDGWPNYGHPGGLQMVGDVLVVPLSHPYIEGDLKFRILFLDVSNPETPVLLSQFNPLQVSPPSSDFGAGQVAVTPVQNPIGPGLRYIMILAGESNKDVRLYRSRPTRADGSTDLKSANLSWDFIRRWNRAEVTDTGEDTWACCGSQSYQMFNFVRQESLNGTLFLIGTYNDEPVLDPGSGNDYIDLFEVHVDQYGIPADHLLSIVRHKRVSTTATNGGGDTSHFSGSTGVYVSPSGELIIYGSEHTNSGPPEILPGGERGKNSVNFGEWRHREMVRPDSPTLRPSVMMLGPFQVDEGSTVQLSALGKHAITKAWLQLFEDDGIGVSFPSDLWFAVDHDDWPKDNFDNFTKLISGFNDSASSWRWFAPDGCTLHVNQHSFDDSDFPGRRKTLVGTGFVEEAGDLDVVKDDQDEGSMNDMISSMQFFCSAYYNAPIEVGWDFDRNGIFEGTGNSQNFSAAELDGPGLISVHLRAKHTTDTTPLGQSPTTTFGITIRNVPPSIANLDLVDSFGFKVGTDLPFAVANLRYTAEASFTDPGKPDHQTAMLDLGDGTILQSSGFDLFADASGGVTGQVGQHHRYRASGTYSIRLEVTDDDQGMTSATKTVRVVSLAEIIGSVVTEIDQRLATATNQRVIRALRDARESLAGHNNGSAHDGALDALASGDKIAALEKIGEAIEALQRAEAAGAGDLSNMKYLLGFTGESVAQGAYQDAVDAVGTPSPGQAEQLERIRQAITDGHVQLVNGEYLIAIELYKDAVGRALSLL